MAQGDPIRHGGWRITSEDWPDIPTQRILMAAGFCRRCGERRDHYKQFCDPCGAQWRVYMRRRRTGVPFKISRRGPKPLVPDPEEGRLLL